VAASSDDAYRTGVYRWWHLSRPSPELLAAATDGWLPAGGTALDLGCGLGTEIGWLAERSLRTLGVDHSAEALRQAAELHPNVTFVRADVRGQPVASRSIDLLVDRGCLHYLKTSADREAYAREAARVTRPQGRFLLRACATNAGRPSGITEALLRDLFTDGWTTASLHSMELPSDTRSMPAFVGRLERAG
jgi:ubiquinone/menaquinone biosynthesis C-methylase UbiE